MTTREKMAGPTHVFVSFVLASKQTTIIPLHNTDCQVFRRVRKKLRKATISFVMSVRINRLKLTGHVMHQQFNIQQLYVLHTLYLCVLYLYENKQRLVPLTA